jgi:hypothetical protein
VIPTRFSWRGARPSDDTEDWPTAGVAAAANDDDDQGPVAAAAATKTELVAAWGPMPEAGVSLSAVPDRDPEVGPVAVRSGPLAAPATGPSSPEISPAPAAHGVSGGVGGGESGGT